MARKLNGTIEDVCALIGFNATTKLIAWHGGRNIYVPSSASDSHPLAGLIGLSAMRALCAEFGDSILWIPPESVYPNTDTKKSIAGIIKAGGGTLDASKATGLSQRHVQRIRRELEELGVLPSVLGTPKNSN